MHFLSWDTRYYEWLLADKEVEDDKLRVHKFQEFQKVQRIEERVFLSYQTIEHLG
jgi:hypothetical protein